jgi:hypothetical protein
MNISQQISSFGAWARKWTKYDDIRRHCRHCISGGQGESHRYNQPDLTAKEFLYAVMRDASVPVADRVHAASALMGIEPDGRPNHNQSDASMNQSAAVH